MKQILTVLILSLLCTIANAQDIFHTKTGTIRFFSDAPLEDIEAINESVISFINISSGEMVFKVPIQQFQFDKSLMEEHFNENYMESEKYPNASFKGTFKGIQKETLNDGQNYPVTVTGDLTIHGVTKSYTTEGNISMTDGKLQASSVFMVKLEDHKIKIPQVVFQNIAEEVEVTVTLNYTPYSN
ncbi:YceI family protein [Limibacter armeniacum]|uniref:YceI family protein n=1 Tax=Limibacter armeniacum TaxID=466084 RepID=UPI002FE5FCA9